MNYFQATLDKINNSNSETELDKIKTVINHPQIGWGELDKIVLNIKIQERKEIIQQTQPN